MRSCCCCFGRRTGRRSSGRSKGANDVSSKGKAQDGLQSPLSCNSYISEYYDAQENFPAAEGPSPTCSTNVTPRHSVACEKPTDSPGTPKFHGGAALPAGGGHVAGQPNGHSHHLLQHPHQHQHQHPHAPPVPANGTMATAPTAGLPLQQQLSQHPPDAPVASLAPTVSLAVGTSELPGGDSFQAASQYPAGASETSEEPLQAGAAGGPMSRFASCLSILESIRIPGSTSSPTAAGAAVSSSAAPAAGGHAAAASGGGAGEGPGVARSRRLGKMEPGCSLRRRDMSSSAMDVREAWDECDDGPSSSGRPFMVRGPDYLRTKVKIPSRGPLYRLLGCDVVSSDTKLTHFARHVNLHGLQRPAVDPHIPPLLIITIMLPLYPPAIFGAGDGSNLSLVYYFGLPPDINLATYENQIALGLLRRFASNGREADGTPTRDRFKLIPRVVNVDEWAQKGPLSPAEHKLLATYNDKPILTRPQHFFFNGPGYLEVDIDIHTYQYLARKAFSAYFTRLKEVVFENAFVIQGNCPEELPEQVLASARMYRIDMYRGRPLRDFITPAAPPAAGAGAAAGPGAAVGAAGSSAAAAGSVAANGGHRRVGSIPEAPEERP